MTTNTMARVICNKAKHTHGIITPTEVMMLVDFAESALAYVGATFVDRDTKAPLHIPQRELFPREFMD